MESLYGIYSLLVTEGNKGSFTNSVSSCRFEISGRGVCFAKAG
jgi:hypothetical protein